MEEYLLFVNRLQSKNNSLKIDLFAQHSDKLKDQQHNDELLILSRLTSHFICSVWGQEIECIKIDFSANLRLHPQITSR